MWGGLQPGFSLRPILIGQLAMKLMPDHRIPDNSPPVSIWKYSKLFPSADSPFLTKRIPSFSSTRLEAALSAMITAITLSNP